MGDVVARFKVPAKRKNNAGRRLSTALASLGQQGTWGFWEVEGEDRLLPDLDAVKYGQFAVEHLSEKPPKVKPKYTDGTLPSYLHKRKTHYFQCKDRVTSDGLPDPACPSSGCGCTAGAHLPVLRF